MTDKQRQEELAQYSHLWTSGEWTLHKWHTPHSRVVLVFAGSRPSASELLAIRQLVPRFNALPVSRLNAEVGHLAEFKVGELSDVEARTLADQARRKGLQVRIEDASRVEYLPVSVQGNALIIDDDELAELVEEEMKRRGVPVIDQGD